MLEIDIVKNHRATHAYRRDLRHPVRILVLLRRERAVGPVQPRMRAHVHDLGAAPGDLVGLANRVHVHF